MSSKRTCTLIRLVDRCFPLSPYVYEWVVREWMYVLTNPPANTHKVVLAYPPTLTCTEWHQVKPPTQTMKKLSESYSYVISSQKISRARSMAINVTNFMLLNKINLKIPLLSGEVMTIETLNPKMKLH